MENKLFFSSDSVFPFLSNAAGCCDHDDEDNADSQKEYYYYEICMNGICI